MLVDMGSIMGFEGGSGLQATLAPDGAQVHTIRTGTAPCYAGVRLHNNGQQYYNSSTGTWVAYSSAYWLVSGTNADFWVRATVTSGTLTNGTTGSWLALTSTQSWDIQSFFENKDTSLQLEIATDSGGSNIVSTVTYTMTAFYDTGA